MGCLNSVGQVGPGEKQYQYACAFCGKVYQGPNAFEECEKHENKECPHRPQFNNEEDADLVKVESVGRKSNGSAITQLQVDPITIADLDAIVADLQKITALTPFVEFARSWRKKSTVPYLQAADTSVKRKLCECLCKAASVADPMIKKELEDNTQFFVASATSSTSSPPAIFSDRASAEAEFQKQAEDSEAALLMNDAGVKLKFQGDDQCFSKLRSACLDKRKKHLEKEPIWTRVTVNPPSNCRVGQNFTVMLPDGNTMTLPVPTQCKFGIEVSYPTPAPPDGGVEACLAVTQCLCAILSAVDECTPGESKEGINFSAAAKAVCRIHSHVVARSSVRHAKQGLLFARQVGVAELPELDAVTKNMSEEMQFPAWWDLSIMQGLDMKDVKNFKVEHADVTNLYGIKILDQPELNRIQTLFDATLNKKYTRDRGGHAVPDRLLVEKAWRVQNAQNWKEYAYRVEQIRNGMSNLKKKGPIMDSVERLKTAIPEFTTEPSFQVDKSANCAWLFHGTNAGEAIAKSDFRTDLSGTNAGTLYGRGVYLAESVSKSDEYTREGADGLRQILICRAALGSILYVDEDFPNTSELERKCMNEEYHSVLGDREKKRGTFREFIVYDEDQVYPEFVVWYKRDYTKETT